MEIKILCERPENMTYEQYKTHMKIQKKYLKEKAKGTLIWESARYIPTMSGGVVQQIQGTFKGDTKELYKIYKEKLAELLKEEQLKSKTND